MSELPAAPPSYNREAEPFWTAATERRLVLPVCDACGHHIWYPRSWCPVCQSESVTWTELSGRGTVYARTVVRRGMGPWAAATPYVVAYVELAEGPRILANIVTTDATSIDVGTPVVAVYVPVAEPAEGSVTTTLVRFAPAQ
jgi:uncharacterized OB-fold protein